MPLSRTPSAVVLDMRPLWADAVGAVLMRAGIEAVGKATTWPSALELVEKLAPDLLVAELEPTEGDEGLEWVRRVKERAPDLQVIAMSTYDDPTLIDAALRAGATALAVKTAQPEDLMSVV